MNSEKKDSLPIRESLLQQIWKAQWVRQGPFPGSDGRLVRIGSSGIENKDSGPDFLSAKIIFDDEVIVGDVELHLRSGDWRSHGHHRDPRYNDVILHVVLWDDRDAPTQLENGSHVPTLVLFDYLNGSMDDLSIRARERQQGLFPCRGVGSRLEDDRLGAILDRAGDERFDIKSARFEVEQILDDPPEVLYRGILGALGYAKNKKPMQKLAGLLPLRVLENAAKEANADGALALQALLLGGGGLLPSQSDGKSRMPSTVDTAVLETAWRSLGGQSAMTRSEWHLFRMHPRNFPTSRLLGAGELIARYAEPGLLAGLMERLRTAQPRKPAPVLEDPLVTPEYIGKGRAREVVVNVILPFARSWAELHADHGLDEHALDVYRCYPRLGENQITRHLSDLFWGKGNWKVVNSARRQQGLIHVYKTFCEVQRCQMCPLGRS